MKGSESIRRKGFALVYVLILMVPVMMIAGEILDLSLMDFKTDVNVTLKQQAYYNAEAGMLDGLRRYDSLVYNGFRISVYYMDFEKEDSQFTLTDPKDEDYAKIKISYTAANGIRCYTVEATGYYRGCQSKNIRNFSY